VTFGVDPGPGSKAMMGGVCFFRLVIGYWSIYARKCGERDVSRWGDGDLRYGIKRERYSRGSSSSSSSSSRVKVVQ
jgi:hypothetical protein